VKFDLSRSVDHYYIPVVHTHTHTCSEILSCFILLLVNMLAVCSDILFFAVIHFIVFRLYNDHIIAVSIQGGPKNWHTLFCTP